RGRQPRLRPIGIVATAIVLAGLSFLARPNAPASPATVPSVPADHVAGSSELLENAPPDDLAAIDDELRLWVPKADADARDDLSAGTVWLLYLGRGRVTGDANDYERALAAADRAVNANPTSTGTQALKATVLQATHDFSGALALAETILAKEPDN